MPGKKFLNQLDDSMMASVAALLAIVCWSATAAGLNQVVIIEPATLFFAAVIGGGLGWRTAIIGPMPEDASTWQAFCLNGFPIAITASLVALIQQIITITVPHSSPDIEIVLAPPILFVYGLIAWKILHARALVKPEAYWSLINTMGSAGWAVALCFAITAMPY